MTDVGQDFTKITDEEVLKKMWQDTNDFGRKKEIRTYMYKLREARLRDLYDMDATGANYNVSKTSSHGDLVADHSFASMKAKEVRDSESPIRDNRGGIIRPATGEWNVISSTEQSSDGKEAKHHTLATTGGVKNISGGKKTFAGLEEEQSHRRVEGDDKNFKRTEGQSSTTQLSEHTVTGNEQDGKVEKFSKSYQTSSSSVTRSGKTITNDFDSPDFAPVQPRSSAIHKNEKYDENLTRHDSRQSMTTSENTSRRESTNRNQEQIYRENVNQQQQQSNQYSKNTSSTNQTDHQNQQVQQNVQKTDTQNISGHHLQTSRDPNRVVEAFRLAEKPGQVVARTVVHTKPDTVCITETKVLTDGTKVTTKRYERVSTQSDIQTLRKQYNAIDSSNTTMRTSTTDKKFTDEMTNQQTNLRQSRAPERTTIDQRTKIDQNNAQVKKIQINQEETETVTKSKIINTDGKEIYLTPGQKIVVEIPGTNVTRVERTEHRETLTKIPGELPAEQDVVIEERFITHYDNKDKVRRDSYTKTEVTEKVVDEQNIQSTSNKTISQKPRQPTQPVDSRNVRDTRISVEVDKTHQAWASSLRCITPPPEGQAQPNYQSPSSKRPSRRSPSRDSDVTKISNTTITRSTQYIPSSNVSKKTVTTEFRTQIQSPDRRPTVKGGRPQRPGTDSESEDQISRKTSLRKTSTDRSENIRTETNKFIRNESTVTDNKVTKSKPVLKRTETYEDRCKFLIGIPDKPTTPTNRQRSEDNLTPRKPNKSVTDDIDTKQKTVNQFTKTTSDITFDKKTLRTAQVNVDKSSPKKPTYKTELKRTISPVDETSDETKNTTHRTEITKIVNVEDDKKFTSDTVSSTLKKVRPSDSVPRDQSPANATTFTTNETETITITRTDNKPVKEPKKPSQDTRKTVNRRFDEYTSTTEDEEYSNTTKIRNETRSSSIKDSNYDKVTSKTPDSNKPQNRGTYKVTETVEITNTVIDDKNKTPTTKKPLKKGSNLVTDSDDEDVRETKERQTSSFTDETISSTLKKTDTAFDYQTSKDELFNQPSARKPQDKQKPSNDFINNERIHSTTTTSETVTNKLDSNFISKPKDKKPYDCNDQLPSSKTRNDKFTKYETETVQITRSVNDQPDQRPSGKKPVLKKGPKLDTDTDEYEESIERRTSSYADDTISSTLKKVDTTFEYNPSNDQNKPENEPWHSASSNEPHPSDKLKHDEFVKNEQTHTNNTYNVVQKQKVEHIDETYESSDYERKVSTTYLDDTVSSNLKKVHPDDIEDHYRTRSRSRDKSPSVTSNTDQRDARNKEKPISEHEPWHQATSNEPHSSDYQKPAYDFITKERIYTDTTTREEKKHPKKYDDKPSYKNTEKIERMEESYESSDYERKVSTTYLDDTVSSNLKKVHPDDIEDHHRTRSRSRDKSPSVTSNTDQRDTRNKEKPISEHEPWHQATSNEPHSSDYQKPAYDFITKERIYTDTTTREEKKHPKKYDDKPSYKNTEKIERMEESYESSDYERKISTTYLDDTVDTVSSNLKKVHPDDIEDHHRTRSRSRDKSPSVSSNVEFTKRTTTIEDEVKLLENYQKTRPNQKSKSEPKTKKRTDSESDTDEEDLVVEQYNVDTTTGKISSYDDETVSSSLKKIKTEPIREKSPRRVVKQLFEEETDEKEFSSKIVTNKKVTEIKQSFEEPKPKNVTPKPTTKIIKEEKITKVREVFEGPSKKPTEIVKNIKVKKTVDDRSSEFITNEITTSKPTTNKPEKVDESTRFIKTEERFTASNTMRQATPTVTKKSTPKSKEDKPRRGSIVEITIDVKEDVVDDQRRSSNSRPSRTHDKKGVTKTKTVTTTVRKEIEDSDEQYSSSDNRRNRRPITKTTTDESPRRKIVTETITIKKDVDDETVNRIKTREELKSSTVKKNSKISSNDEKTPINPKLIKTSDVDSPKVGKHQKKCITTKTINLTTKTINSDNLQENIIIDIQKAKSSREPSPNRLIPVPVSPDNEHVKTLPQRFPDKVVEPDDVKQKRKPVVKNIPIFEEQTNDFVGIKIEEVDDSTIDIRETSTNYTHTEVSSDDDVATLSVSQKVSKFITEAEKLKSPSPSRSTKFDRDVNFDKKRERFINEKIIEEASESETETITRRKESVETYSDRCFLDKKPKYPDSHESSPILTRKLSDRFDDRHTKEKSPSVTLKSTEVVQNITKKTTQKFETKDFDRPVTKESSPVSLKSTEAVKKAKAIFETKASPSLGTTPSKPRPFLYDTKTAVNEEDFEKKNITLVEAYEEKIVPRSAYKTYKKDQTPERQSSRSRLEDEIIPIRDSDELISASRPYSKTPEREPVKQSPVKQNPVKTREEPSYLRKETQNYESSYNTKTTSKSPRRPSNDNPPRNSNPSRTSYDESPQRNNPQRRDSSGNAPHNPNRRYSSETPPYMKDAVSTKKDIFEKKITTTNTETFERRKSMSPQVEDLEKPVYNNKSHTSKVEYERSSSRELPSYMSPTVSSLVHSNRKFSIETQVKQVQNVVEEDEHVEEIVLKNKRPSYQRTPSKETPRKMSVTEGNIEDIFDLEILERMLETVVGYEQRRRIRAQIRIVKKLITEGKVTTDGNVSTKLTTKTTTTTRRQSSEHTAPQTRDSHVVESYHTVRNMSPATAKRTTTTTVEEYRAKNNEQPKLVKKETHKTVSGYGTPKRTTPQKSTAKTTTKQQETKTSQRTSNREEFGVTPAFEDGMPLFGLKALRKRDGPSYVQSKVTGTTVTEKRYSENGKAPIGERKVTHYSTDPSDLEKLLDKDQRTPSEIREKLFERQHSRSKGISAVTLIEKFGEDIEQERAILDNVSEPSTVATNTSRTSRKSVEALKQKFSSMDQSSSVTETTTSCYPKAGLILRSQSRSSRSSTPGASSFRSGSVDFDESDVEIRSLTRKTSRERISSSRQIVSHDPFEDDEGATKSVKRITTKITKSGGGNKVESFLDSESKVTDIQDLLSRMKALDNAPKKAGETSEDHEARALLNRFLGATVLMSGAEQILSDSGDSGIANQKVTTKTSTSTRTFSSVHPASGNKAIDTENINDEETLRQLIESSTSYDERRILRARLRQLMADKGTTGDKNITKKEESSEVTMHKTLGNESTMTKAVTTKTVSSSISKNNSSSTTALKSSSNSSLNKVQANQSLFMKNMSSLTGVSATSSPAVATTVTPRGESNIQKMLQWAQNKTRGYENVKIENFSSSWQDGMAFCALIHHFYPDAFDFSKLNPKNRRGNFTLAFRVAEDKAGIAPLLDVDDMVMMKKPDWKCVFTYVQSMHRHLREKSI
uniref:CSON009985 protein n=1 Tax=Culicoides sonorensis TaxID=179676 RepID=A0A336JX32_CULSO